MTGEDAVPEISEALLVRRAKGGDMAAFEALYRRHSGRVNALCLRMTGDRGKAEDCVQEAFVQAWRRIGSFEGRSAFGTWMHRIAVNQLLSMQRKEARRPGFLESFEDRTEEPMRAGAPRTAGCRWTSRGP